MKKFEIGGKIWNWTVLLNLNIEALLNTDNKISRETDLL
jgi:hypothetical protein